MTYKFEDMFSFAKKKPSDKDTFLTDIFSKHKNVFLSDLIINDFNEGQSVLEAVGNYENRTKYRAQYIIKVLKDEYGNKPNPGDKVIRKVKKPRILNGQIQITPMQIAQAQSTGRLDQLIYNIEEYIIDDKGCIRCDFEAASMFLKIWGIHSATKQPITRHEELSSEPVKTPSGDKLHVHYWRYEEVTTEDYENLPVIESNPKPKRGYNNKKD